jgi:DNA adenine methylase
MTAAIEPVIKWSGSKRKIARKLVKLMPLEGRYFEPFLGGGAVLGAMGRRPSTAGDVIPELVALWQGIKLSPESMADSYEENWLRLQSEGHLLFYEVRDRFNEMRQPEDLLFLSRTCVNGLIRFNRQGDFNNSFHHTRPGISPQRLRKVIFEWSGRVSETEFVTGDYVETLRHAVAGDIVYLDPPYAATKGRYRNGQGLDQDRFWGVLRELTDRGVLWVLSFDGQAGDRDYRSALADPIELATLHVTMDVGSSPFPRVMNGRIDDVKESVFFNYDPQNRGLGQFLEVVS